MSVRVLHAADLHLDSPFEALPAGKAALRRQEQRLLLSRIAQTAKDTGAQVMLLAGDLLDTGSAYKETTQTLIDILGQMNIPVFISPGNHDYYTDHSPYARMNWPDNVHIFSEPYLDYVDVEEIGVRVWGAAFNENRSVSMLENFEAEREDDIINLMCIHGEVGNEKSIYNPITETQIMCSGMNYIALGHIHKESGLCRSGDTYYAWPGCPEGRGFDETGEKYIYIADVSADDCKLWKACVAMRKYEKLSIAYSGDEDLMSQLPEETENDIYRLTLTGETVEQPDVKALMEQLQDRFFSLQILDKTRLSRDIWDSAGDDSLRGRFLIKLKESYEQASSDEEKELIEKAARWGLAALENAEEVSPLEN